MACFLAEKITPFKNPHLYNPSVCQQQPGELSDQCTVNPPPISQRQEVSINKTSSKICNCIEKMFQFVSSDEGESQWLFKI